MNTHTHVGVYGLAVWEQFYLLIQKARGPYYGKWDLPGGRMEFGESPETALKREFDEETGIIPLQWSIRSSQSVVVNWEYRGEPEAVHHIGILYDVIIGQDNNLLEQIKRNPDGEDSLGAVWFTLEQVKDLQLTPFAQYMMNLSQKER